MLPVVVTIMDEDWEQSSINAVSSTPTENLQTSPYWLTIVSKLDLNLLEIIGALRRTWQEDSTIRELLIVTDSQQVTLQEEGAISGNLDSVPVRLFRTVDAAMEYIYDELGVKNPRIVTA